MRGYAIVYSLSAGCQRNLYLLQVGNLFPWNAFITAATYFAARFCGSLFGDNFENYFSFCYTLSQTVGLALSIKYQNSLSLRSKIIYPLVMYSVSFLVTTILVTFKADAVLLFGVTLFQTALCGVCGAVLSGGLFGLGATFPPAYTGALMSGQGLAGLIVSVANVLTLLASSPVDDCKDDTNAECIEFSVDFSALAYFIIATVILGFCGVAFLVLQNLDYTK
jgi:equilibrative nucleoside transporter 1/2/3